ncbi:PREDICTED: next to BRCA1 gene 1 protein [Propithecus coquereli]|uniref:next to BRCA1 gene 1 protein n=1 Tax=Propithecus coquereli TaxID=379532 RepID=UPI00063F5EDE|nr:PREDICTED: next to BRCA1 gene 1 protein [Propithecus coquereli]
MDVSSLGVTAELAVSCPYCGLRQAPPGGRKLVLPTLPFCTVPFFAHSLCPSYNICEDCEAGPYAHDTNHVLLKLRRPVAGSSEPFSHSKYSTIRLPAALEQVRLQKQVDKNFLKAEKQRLHAEKKQRKAEVKELKKQLKLHRKIHLWNSIHGLQSPKSPLGRPENLLQANTLMLPLQPCAPVMPMLSAAFVDENLPDGTHLQPGTKFIKHWRMKNTGNIKWSADTKLKFMWGNLTLASTEKKDVLVPCLKAGHVGVVSVEFIAPALEGTYTSHWRLSHKGQQFGPRVWCSIIVDPFPSEESPNNIEKAMIGSSKADDLTCEQEVSIDRLWPSIPGHLLGAGERVTRIWHCCAVFTVLHRCHRCLFTLLSILCLSERSPPCVQHHGSPGVDLPVTIPEVSSVSGQIRGEPRGSSGLVNSRQKSYDHSRHYHGSGIAGGLVKGALSVAASAYKALFAGPPVTAQPIVSEDQTAAQMAHLFEMGFCDRQLNLRLLKKHNYNILQVVTELLQVNNNDWYSHRY